jgi:Histidine kinase-, DNA gyrase B-, and HSP90-like ATPase
MTVAELPRRRSSATLERVAFKTSRLAEFCGQRELVAQTGHAIEDWALVIVKELVDNALDACEETEIAPEIAVEVDSEQGLIVITDNGPGIAAETIDGILDYAVRVSSREAYVSPSRGQQGNAMKCIIAMPFAIDGARGCTAIESRGQTHRITFEMDPIRRVPQIQREAGPSDVIQNGSRITVYWPQKASDLIEAAKPRFVQTAWAFTTFNPHLTLRGRWDDWEFANIPATNPGWRKWRACDPTSAHWYDPKRFERYIAAHIARDEDHGATGRTVREFVSELDGLSRTEKQKRVLAETGTSGMTLARFFEGRPAAITHLLSICQNHTKPVRPERLGLIGPDHLRDDCCSFGGDPETFAYRKHLGVTFGAGLPYAIEAAFAYCPDDGVQIQQLIAGVNFSIGIGSPFERINQWSGLTALLEGQHVNRGDPVIVVLHYTCPVVEFLDRGKGVLALPQGVGIEIKRLVEALTKGWDKQKRAEIRQISAEANRRQRLLKEKTRPEKEAPPEPIGALAEKISTVAAEAGLSIDDLTVLSRDPYTAWRRRRDGEWFARLFDRFVAPDATKHLRGFFYLLVSAAAITASNGKPFVNDFKNWQLLQKAATAARWLGLVPFSRIVDERNAPPEIFTPAAISVSTWVSEGEQYETPESVKDVIPSVHVAGRGRQSHRIIFYGEKSSLAVVLRPIAEMIGAEMILVTGESSDRFVWEMVDRASQDGRPAIVCYFADFDPSGHQMAISVARKIQALRDFQYPNLDIKLYRVALTIEQVRALDLPSSPLKATEKRAQAWRAKHGHDQTEIDAMVELHPEALRQAALEIIKPFYDGTLEARESQAKAAWREKADEALQAHPDYQDLSARIEQAYERAQAAIAELQGEQEHATEILQETLPGPPELPSAAPSGEAKPALYDSDDDFLAASLRLIADKKLDDDGEPDE